MKGPEYEGIKFVFHKSNVLQKVGFHLPHVHKKLFEVYSQESCKLEAG